MYIPRTLETYVARAAQQFPVILLTGTRQVGKTTLLRHLGQAGRADVTLDDPLVLSLAKTDPALFMQRFPPPVLIDEIQYATELLPYIKMAADRVGEPGLFWLDRSQQFHLMKGVSESLAGRAAALHLLGFSRRELLGQGLDATPFVPMPEEIAWRSAQAQKLTLKELYRLIWRGALPAIALNEAVERVSLRQFLRTDLFAARRARPARSATSWLSCAFCGPQLHAPGQILNLSGLRATPTWPRTRRSTGSRFWKRLRRSDSLEPYHTNVTQRLVKAPELYFLDTGLAADLTEWASPETLEAGALSGPI
jgi:predicted AAA+ superfamily ATPase